MSHTQRIQGVQGGSVWGRFNGDVTKVWAGFYDVIYVWLVKITSSRNLRVIYGVNRNLATALYLRIRIWKFAWDQP